MAQWLSWLERRPVTAKVESSSLFWVVSNELTSLVNCIWIWNLSSAGRASALQAEGHRFEPYCSHHYGLVVQLVRTLACHARGRRFDPDPGRQFASVAQSVEQGTENPRVIGSIPIGGTINADVAHPVERHLAKVEVASSSLVIRSKKDA